MTQSQREAGERARRLHPSELSAARQVLAEAFLGYPLMQYAQPRESRRLAACQVLYGAILRDALRYGEIWTTAERTAIACWLPPATCHASTWRQARAGMLRLALWPGPRGLERLMAYDRVGQVLHHRGAPMAHWYLAVVGVAPKHQGRGLARGVLEPVWIRADAEGLPCYLETHDPANVPRYEHYGFRVTEMRELRGRPVRIWGMLRPVGG